MGACISSNYCSRARHNSIPNRLQQLQNMTSATNLLTQNNNFHNEEINTTQNNAAVIQVVNIENITNNVLDLNEKINEQDDNIVNSNPIPSILNANSNYLLNHLNSYSTFSYYVPPTGKNKRIKKDIRKYFKCEKKVSELQLQAKRDEFWDTAPAFDGKPEIWAALKASVEAYENKNFVLAQAIIDSANIILPNGLLSDCYDELGNRYQLPIYILAKPTNLVHKSKSQLVEEEESTCSSTKNKINEIENDDDFDNGSKNVSLDEDLSSDEKKSHSNKAKMFKKKLRFFKFSKNNSNFKATTSKSQTFSKNKTNILDEKVISENNIIPIKVRISSLNNDEDDIKLEVNLNQTVLNLKSQLFDLTNIDVLNQRIFFGGKLLRDKERLRNHKLYKNVVLQVIVRENPLKQVLNE